MLWSSKSVIFLFLTFLYLPAYTQSDIALNPDSLYEQASNYIDSSNFEEAIKLFEQVAQLELHKEKPNQKRVSEAYGNMGYCYQIKGEMQSSLKVLNLALHAALLSQDSAQTADIYGNLGNTHIYLGNYQEALTAFTNALQIDQALNDTTNIAFDLNSIGKVYEFWKKYSKALDFFEQSLNLAYALKNQNMVALRLASIGSVYKSMGENHIALKKYMQALQIEQQLGNIVREGYRLDQIGEVYLQMNQFALANDHFSKALTIFRDYKVNTSETIVLNHMALSASKRRNYGQAEKLNKQSLKLAQSIGFSNMILKNYQELASLYENLGDYKNALYNHKIYNSLKDSSFTEDAQHQLMEFQTKYETEKKEKEIALLNQEKLVQELKIVNANQQKTWVIAISVFLIIMLGALYSRYLLKQRTNALLISLNRKLNDLNSTKDKLFSVIAHDLRNSMTAFCNISESMNTHFEKISPENLRNYLTELSQSAVSVKDLLKNLLDWAQSQQNAIVVSKKTIHLADLVNQSINHINYVSTQKEIEVINNTPEDFIIKTDENILYTVFRNLLTNAVKYTPVGGQIAVDLVQTETHVAITVTDTGIGMSEVEQSNLFELKTSTSKPGIHGEKGSGLGLVLSMELIKRLDGRISVSSKPNQGSCFTITIPII